MTGSNGSLTDAYDLVIFDLDGVVYLGHDPIAGAIDAINGLVRAGKPVAEEDEDYDDEEELEERSAASEPPVHPDDDDIDEADLPERPSKRRTPVGRR